MCSWCLCPDRCGGEKFLTSSFVNLCSCSDPPSNSLPAREGGLRHPMVEVVGFRAVLREPQDDISVARCVPPQHSDKLSRCRTFSPRGEGIRG